MALSLTRAPKVLPTRTQRAAPCPKVQQPRSRKAMVCKADASFIGSPTNLIMVSSIGACLFASRFGLAPSVRKVAQPLKLSDREVLQTTGDPAGFTATDVLAMGAAGHAIGVGIVLGLKGIGQL
ncbi:photosystem I reaction center subunit psaK, chloroplastic-like protein [Dunaliella salina]|uniref:Photosystem I reaction center subunit psaK, chloroplastic-like protein n=3 Tax=Dunaliella salina TaxID=3046 RepID=A0ABQ7H0N5_DUNSA|nr:photosystem I reaction center subunit psaK, chloroplastic-like protein [Dunaliella salina]|eukprot:KAF5840417.1 photosystem I reaction center subunit psaK, chloroplastic-like protein [Dunaliella salina]